MVEKRCHFRCGVFGRLQLAAEVLSDSVALATGFVRPPPGQRPPPLRPRISPDQAAVPAAGHQLGENKFPISEMGRTQWRFEASEAAVACDSTDNECLVVWEGDDVEGGLIDEEFQVFGQRFGAFSGLWLPLVVRGARTVTADLAARAGHSLRMGRGTRPARPMISATASSCRWAISCAPPRSMDPRDPCLVLAKAPTWFAQVRLGVRLSRTGLV